MTGAFGSTINLAASEFRPAGRTRVNRRGCITASCDLKFDTGRFAGDFEYSVQLYSYRKRRERELAIRKIFLQTVIVFNDSDRLACPGYDAGRVKGDA